MKTSRFISLLLCVIMIMSLFTGLAGSASADDVITHEVKSGEILLKICENHGLNYYTCKNAIMQLNGFTSEAQLARLNVGQQLKLPASNAVAGTVSTTTATVTTTTVGGTTMTTTSYVAGAAAGGNVAFYLVPYTVKNGDTLNKICNELGSNYYYYSPVIQGINALANPNSIYAGQVLLIPTPAATGATSAVISHVVKAGETMSSIANQYGLNYQAQRQLINGLNRRDNMDKIYVGQTVLIPGAATASTGSVVTTATTAATASTTSAAASGSYQISISAAENGSPYAVVNNTQFAVRANAGETVDIVPSPKAGYAVRSIQVVRTDSGTDIPVSNYSFTMPNSSVQVTVDYSRGLVINKMASPYGTFDTMIYGTSAGTAFFGDEVTLSIYPKNGYNVKFPNDATKVSGVYYQKSDLSMERVYVFPDNEDGMYRFKMPNYEIRLTVEFVISNYFSLGAGNKSGAGSIAYYVDGEKVTRAKEGDTVTVQFVPTDGWVFRNDLYESGSDGLAVLRNSVKDKMITKINDNTYSFVVGSMAVNPGKYIFENRVSYGIWADVREGHGWVSFQRVEEVTPGVYNVVEREISRAMPGKLVEVVFHPDNEYAFTNVDFMKNNSRGSWSGNQLNAGAWTTVGNRYIFQMPQEDATIVLKYHKTGEVYYDLNLEYDWTQGTVVALQGGQTVSRAKAGEEVTLQITANDNRRVSGVQWLYEGSGDNVGVPFSSSGDKTWTAKFKKHAGWDTIRIYFEEYAEYTKIDTYQYHKNTLGGTVLASNKARIAFRDQPVAGSSIRVGNTFTFRVVPTRTGFSVGEVWVLRDGNKVRMLSPIFEGGDTYSYTVTKEDKGAKIQFVAVQLGEEPQHYIIPEYTIANTGIVNVGAEKLYKVEYFTNGTKTDEKDIGQYYGMGANLAVDDVNIKAGTMVKVKVTIPKKEHYYKGVSTTLIYQVDTVTIRFSDYVLNNYKVLQDGTDEFTYEFWYNELSDLNIMVNYKEIGTVKNEVTSKSTTLAIDGLPVDVTKQPDGTYKGTLETDSGTSEVKITITP